eukprot:c9944_g1_i2 orf=316-645(-)
MIFGEAWQKPQARLPWPSPSSSVSPPFSQVLLLCTISSSLTCQFRHWRKGRKSVMMVVTQQRPLAEVAATIDARRPLGVPTMAYSRGYTAATFVGVSALVGKTSNETLY